jgi:hypothetical protein
MVVCSAIAAMSEKAAILSPGGRASRLVLLASGGCCGRGDQLSHSSHLSQDRHVSKGGLVSQPTGPFQPAEREGEHVIHGAMST